MLNNVESKIFLEGIELKDFSSYSLILSEKTTPALQLNVPRVKGLDKLMASTIVHVFVNYPGSQEWFLIFEGELLSINYSISSMSKNGTLYFKSSVGIYDRTYHSKYDLANYLTGVTEDTLYGNIGIKTDNQTGKDGNLTVINNPTSMQDTFFALASWKKMEEGLKAGTANSTATFYKSLLDAVSENNPYLNIIETSLQLIKRIKVFSNDTMCKAAADLQFYGGIRKKLQNDPGTVSYMDILRQISNYTLTSIQSTGIPLKYGDEIINTIVIPTNTMTTPPMSNVIYPDEFTSYQITFDQAKEPTRAMNSSFTLDFLPMMGLSGLKTTPLFMAPVGQLVSKDLKDGKYFVKFTEEEKIRGINPLRISTMPLSYKANLVKNKEYGKMTEVKLFEKEAKEILPKDVDQSMYSMMLYLTENLYYLSKLEARGMSTVTLPYLNLNWMLGFPGVLLTVEHGPILVNFQSMTISVNPSGAVSTSLMLTKPRFLNDLMDFPSPQWQEIYLQDANIGKDFYSKFGKKGTSIKDYTGKTTNEEAVKELAKMDKVPFVDRELNLVSSSSFYSFLKVKTDGKFPNPTVTEYREAKLLDALQLAYEKYKGLDQSYLECPFVLERGNKVLEYLELDVKLVPFSKKPGPFKRSDAESLFSRAKRDSADAGNSSSHSKYSSNSSDYSIPDYAKELQEKTLKERVENWRKVVEEVKKEKCYDVNTDVILSIIAQESSGGVNLIGTTDDFGVMQINAQHYDKYGVNPQYLLDNPKRCIEIGCDIFNKNLRACGGSYEQALSMYNTGQKSGSTGQAYADSVLTNRKNLFGKGGKK